MQHSVAHQNESGIVGHLAPFMKIERERIGALDSFEPRRQIGRENRQRAEGPIDVEPEPLATANIGERIQIVNGSGIDRARGSDDQKRREARATVGFDRVFEAVQCRG